MTLPRGEDDRGAPRAGRSFVVRRPLDIHVTGSQEVGDASRGTSELIVVRTCNSKEASCSRSAIAVNNQRHDVRGVCAPAPSAVSGQPQVFTKERHACYQWW